MARTSEGVIKGFVSLRRLEDCYDCRECSNWCPSAQRTVKFNSRRIARRAGSQPLDSVAMDKNIWLCTTCHSCYERCPKKVPFVKILMLIKNLAIRRGNCPEAFKETAISVLKSGRAIPLTGATARIRSSLGLPELPNVPINDVQKILELSGFTSLKFLGKSKE